MKNCFLGIDTSAYTTSVALVDGNGIVLANEKMVLPVPPGERGLRQSDALFHHIRQLPVLFERLRPLFTEYELRGVGVSDRPRPMPESYMPVFFAGVSAATAISSARGVPLKTFSHQEGHIAAALAGSESTDLFNRSFLSFHISGGTTDGVAVFPKVNGFDVVPLCTSADLHAGQLVDRIGVMLGLPFPAGPELEKLALSNQNPLPVIPRQKADDDGNIHLSGVENRARDFYAATADKALTADYVLHYLEKSLTALTRSAQNKASSLGFDGTADVVYVGGVMGNTYLQSALKKTFTSARFAPPPFSSDNAVGVAYLTKKSFTD